MSTTNFASIIDNIIPLQEENKLLKQRISEQEVRSEQMHVLIQQLEERLKSIEYELSQPYEEVTIKTTETTEATEATEAQQQPTEAEAHEA
jgi:predicted RNA-binding Zn ribbon-like protein